jgi:hypothetical protein
MVDDVTRVTKVRPAGGRVLRVRFAGDRRDHKLDMTGLIARSAHFAPLMDDAESFARVVIVEDGLGLAWNVSASTLRRIRGGPGANDGSGFRVVEKGILTVADRGRQAAWRRPAHDHRLS